MAICYILRSYGIFFPFWYVVPKKNLATLIPCESSRKGFQILGCTNKVNLMGANNAINSDFESRVPFFLYMYIPRYIFYLFVRCSCYTSLLLTFMS
jgi:hypothetical protein